MIDRFFISFIFILFSFGHLGRISLFNQEINFYGYEGLMAMYLLFLFFENKLVPVFNFVKKNYLVVISYLFFLFSFLINLPRYQVRENYLAFLYFLRIIFYTLFFIYFYWDYQKKNLRKETALGLKIFVLITIFFSLTQYFFYPNLRNIIYLGWDPHWYRMLGLFFDSFLAGAIYGLLVIYFFLKKELFYSFVFFIFTVLTFSRNVYFSLIITLGLYLLTKRNLKELLFFILFFSFLMLTVPRPFGESVNLKRLFTIEARLEDYRQAFLIWKKRPLLGIGYNHIGAEKLGLTKKGDIFGFSHALGGFSSSYLIILVTGGIVGLMLFIFLLKKLLLINRFSYWGGLFILLTSFFDNVILHPFIIFLYLIMIISATSGRV